jgi:general secretion pathway protein D
MFRFMPLEGANAVLVITPQPSYLDQIQQWLERIDGAGAGVQLFSYELKYIKAKDLADRLSEVFGGSSSGGRATGGDGNVSLAPGADPFSISGSGSGSGSKGDAGYSDAGGGLGGGMDSTTGGGSGIGDGSLRLDPRQNGNGSVTLEVEGDRVGVSAVDETNTLLVRTTSRAWKSIRDVVERLDVMPMQVHIEAQIAEVTLTGDLKYGVNWYFERAVTDAGLPSAEGRTTWSTLAGSVLPGASDGSGGLAWTFLGRNAAAVISALDQVTDVQVLQSPSVLVRNNAEATFNVGSRIPISSVSFDPGTGGTGTYNNVQYIETGTILNVRPRVTKDGMVFLDIVQEVSTPGPEATADENGNVRIDTRKLKTEAAVRSGDTVMLAGLIRDEVGRGSSGFPGLSRIPIIGGLFGQQKSSTGRSEVIILLTPMIIRNPQEARDLTDEYSRRFRAMEPLNPKRKK